MRYKFSFIRGGFNFVYADDISAAIKKSRVEFGNSVRIGTVKPCSDAVYFDLLRATM